MLDYETLDSIADIYLPLLGAISLTVTTITGITGRWQLLGIQAGALLTGLLIAYGLMFIDDYFRLWPLMDLDYSTHTAVALVLITFLIITLKQYVLFWISSLVLYILLMLYQGYHTLADITTTAFVIGLIVLPGALLFFRGSLKYDE